jgi:hypothetical protein
VEKTRRLFASGRLGRALPFGAGTIEPRQHRIELILGVPRPIAANHPIQCSFADEEAPGDSVMPVEAIFLPESVHDRPTVSYKCPVPRDFLASETYFRSRRSTFHVRIAHRTRRPE